MFWSAFFFTLILPKEKKTPRGRRCNDKLNTFFMPSKQKRHTCIYCKKKRVETKMKSLYTRNYKQYGWFCDLSFMPLGSNVERYCSKRTPKAKHYLQI